MSGPDLRTQDRILIPLILNGIYKIRNYAESFIVQI